MKTRMLPLLLAAGMFLFQHLTLQAQCVQPNLVNGGFEFSVPGFAFVQSPSGGWTAQGGWLEVWGPVHEGVAAYEGSNFLELNVNGLDVMYQDVATTPGQTYHWSVAHRARLTAPNIANIEFGPVGGPYQATTMSSGVGSWTVYSGTYTATSATTRIRLASVNNSPGFHVSVGNLIDALTFSIVYPDTDGDGVLDCEDNCIETANSGQEDGDGDGIGDVCDACPTISDPNCAGCGNGKYLVCHVPAGNPENTQQLCIPLAAANTHIGNHGGCFWGMCNPGMIVQDNDDPAALHTPRGHTQGSYNPLIETASGATYFFEVTPNPATEAINIHLHGHEEGAHLYLRDQLGRLLWNQPVSPLDSEFNVPLSDSRFVSGTYYLTILNNGETITRQLLVVK